MFREVMPKGHGLNGAPAREEVPLFVVWGEIWGNVEDLFQGRLLEVVLFSLFFFFVGFVVFCFFS